MLRQRLSSLHACSNAPLASLLSQVDLPGLQATLCTPYTTSAAPQEQHGAATASRAQATPQQQQQQQQQQRQAQQAQQALLQKYTSGQRGGGMIRSMGGAGSPPMTDLARENAPSKVLELIGDPRSGVADDVARNPFGSLTVDMVHYQPSNEVYWYKYELDGNSMKETHRDARLSEYSKNLLYLLRAKDPNRWTIAALSKKFRIRKQRVMAILALKEMEGHSLERSIEQGGPMSAYACRVHMSDLNLDPASGEPMELGSDELRRLEIDAANAAVSPPPPTSVLQDGVDPQAAVAEADPAVLPLHNALPRAAVMTHQVQLELLASLRSHGFDLQRLRAEVQAGLEQAEARLRANLPGSVFEQQQQENSDSPEQGEAGTQASAEQQQQHTAVSAAVSALLEQKRHTLALLDSLEDVLLKPQTQGAAERRPFRSTPLEQERHIAAVVSALPRALSSANFAASNPSSSSSSSSSSGGGSPSLDGLLAGLEGQQLLRVVHSLQPAARAALLSAHPPTKVALNTLGVDLTALMNPTASARAAPGSTPSPTSQAHAQLFPDVLGYTYISPVQYARLQHTLSSLGSAAAAAAGAVQTASPSSAALPSPQEGHAQQQQQQQQAMLPAQIVASAARFARSYRAISGAHEQMWSREQKSDVNQASSPEDVARRLRVMAEVDPELVEAAYDVEAVMQVRKLGTRSTEDKEAQLWWDALQRYKATHEGGNASSSGSEGEAEGSSAKRKNTTDVMKEGGSGPARNSWDAIAAWLDVFPGGKVYHRGSGERQITRMPSYPAFEGLPLSAIDSLQESELSAVNRAKAAEQEEQLWGDFHSDLIYNLGLRGEGLKDNSSPPQPTNLTSSVDDAPMVVYDITREGNTVHPPLFVLDQNGRRPLNEQEQVFQERRLREVQATQFPWLRPHYTVRRTKYKPELQ